MRFDQIAKGILRTALSPSGKAHSQREIVAEVQWADLWFEPARALDARHKHLGLLGRMTAGACMIEPFHNTPGLAPVRGCVRKLLSLHRSGTLDAMQSERAPSSPRSRGSG